MKAPWFNALFFWTDALKVSSSPLPGQWEIIPVVPDAAGGASGCAQTPLPCVGRVGNPSVTLSAHLTLFLLCVLDKESGVHLLQKKTCWVYKCCYRWGCYSDSPVPTGSLGTNTSASFPLDPSTRGRSELKLAHFSGVTAIMQCCVTLHYSRCSTYGSIRKKLLKHKSYRNISILRPIMF